MKEIAMIVARIFGGIGNQLFAYSAARRLALFNNVELVIDHISGFTHDIEYGRSYALEHFRIPCRKATASERLEPFGRIRRALNRNLSRFYRFKERTYLFQDGLDFDRRLLGIRTKKKLYLEGYWQSERYFKDSEHQIRIDLQIIPPEDADNIACAEIIRKRLAVAVHVRFFDEPSSTEHGNTNNAPADYYARAVRAMEAQVSGDLHYFIFSDRPESVRGYFPIPDDRVTLITHNKGDENAYADLWLMTQCQHFIIANSTFSWWGAWLAGNANKIVIAPKFEKRDGASCWGFDGLLPEDWQKI